ncbi:MAG: endosialidase [bacterium]
MAAIKELIFTEENGGLSFGDYELAAKTKRSDYEHDGDLYKVKTYSGITRLERNELLVYESVPGTAVHDFGYTEEGLEFYVEGPEDAQITVEGEEDSSYTVFVDGKMHGIQKTGLGGKLTFGVELGAGKMALVQIRKVD